MTCLLHASTLARGLSFTGSAVLAAAAVGQPAPTSIANPADIAAATKHVKVALGASLSGQAVSTAQTRPHGCSVKYSSR